MNSNSNTQFLSLQRKAQSLAAHVITNDRIVSASEREELAELSTVEAYCSTCRAQIGGRQIRNHARLGHRVEVSR